MPQTILNHPHFPTPFGSVMLGRGFNGEKYRFGFNGKEKNTELNSDNYDFGARIYDGRIGRWFSVDPLFKKYTFFSPYVFTANSVLINKEVDGKDYIVVFDYAAKKITIQAQYEVITSDNVEKDNRTKSNLQAALNHFNNTQGFQVLMVENGKEVIYDVAFQLNIKENNKLMDGVPTNTVEEKSIEDIQAITTESKAIGYYSDKAIGIGRDWNNNMWTLLKHEIGHSLGFLHDDDPKSFMADLEVFGQSDKIKTEHISNSLNNVGIGAKTPTNKEPGEAWGRVNRKNLIFTEQKDLDEHINNRNKAVIKHKDEDK